MKKEEFIKKSNETHTIQYDYSLLKDEFKCDDNIDVICFKHGVFHPRASRFMKGSNCPLCSKKALKITELFVDEYKEKYGIYDLSKFDYKNSHTKGIAICKNHGEFKISPTNLLNGCGCPECKKDKLKNIFSSNKDEFIRKAKTVHGDLFEYLGDYVNNSTPIEIKCQTCGNTFFQLPHNHLSGKGCPFCNQSHLEKKMKKVLDNNNIEYIYQKRFDWLGKQTLDFYIPKLKIGIECQGIQHFVQTKYGNIETNISNDEKKYNLCKENGVALYYLLPHKIDVLPPFYTNDNTFYLFDLCKFIKLLKNENI